MSYQQHQSPEHDQAEQMTNQVTGLGKKAGEKAGNVAKEAGKKAVRKVGNKLLKIGAKVMKKVAVAMAKALAKAVVLLIKPILIILAVALVILAIWWIVYEIRGSEQDYALDPKTAKVEYNVEEGYFTQSDEFSGQTKAIKEFYNYFGTKRASWQIKGNDNKNLIPSDHADAVKDYYNKEQQFTINPNFLFALDEFAYKRQLRYPEQFVEPVNYDPGKLKLVHLTDDEGLLSAKSTKYVKKEKTDEKVKGVWDYGFGTIFKYKKDKIVRTVEGTYNYKDVWDDTQKKVVKVPINEPYSEVMAGFPEEIDLMTHAITFTGDYTFEYEVQKTPVSETDVPVKEGTKSSKKNEAVTQIYYGTYDHYEDVPVMGMVPYEVEQGYVVWVPKTRQVPIYGLVWYPYPHQAIIGYRDETYYVQENRTRTVTEYREEQVGTRKEFRGSYDLYKHRTATVYESIPVEKPKKETLSEEEQKKREEQKLRYLEDYLFYFQSYVPESVMESFDFQGRVGQLIETNMQLGGSAKFGNGNYAGAMQHWDIVNLHASKYGIEPEAIIAKMAQESGGRANIEDGVMQITGNGRRCTEKPSTGPAVCVNNEADRRNPDKAIAWGVAYFAVKLEKYNGDYLKAIQSHNLDPQWIFNTYPHSADTLDWLNYREEMRLHYGQKEGYGLTKSASYDCMPGFDSSGMSGRTTYGDVCYLEHVLRYYTGSMLKGLDSVDAPSKTEEKKTSIVNAIKSFFGISPKQYLEDEKRFFFENRFTEQETDRLLRVIKTYDTKSVYSKVDLETDMAFWEKGSGAGSGGDMSRDEFLALVGNVDYAPPIAFDVSKLVTSKYNAVESVRNGRTHKGIDIGIPTGTHLYAVSNGTVVVAVGNQTHSKESWGNYVKIKLDDGNYVLYAHMNYVDVKVGQKVQMGDYIGDSGNSGHSTGPHLHFEFYYQSPEKSALKDPTHIVVQPEIFQ